VIDVYYQVTLSTRVCYSISLSKFSDITFSCNLKIKNSFKQDTNFQLKIIFMDTNKGRKEVGPCIF